MSVKEERKTARSLEKSLKSTHQGLAAFLQSLERSGFTEAVSAYQQMQIVLIQQRLWSRGYRRDELNPLWRKIAETAGAICDILAPFSAIMETLKDIDRIEAADGGLAPRRAEGAPEDPAMNELADLLMDELTVSHFKLSCSLSWPEEERKSRLRELIAAGVIERRGWGRGQSYRLTPASRQWLATELAHLAHKSQGE
jgi:hypothetical protein